MAHIEFNALSVYLGGTFSSQIYLPEMDKLALDDEKHAKRYPVLWLIHSEGGASCDWNTTAAEALAVRYGMFIIAPDVGHSLCTDMDYGPEYERFLCDELRGICANTFPISEEGRYNWIGGVGTGAYGAVKLALKHPGSFARCFALDGVLDMAAVCDRALSGAGTGIFHTARSLEAVFGPLRRFRGGNQDIFALAAKTAAAGEFYISCRAEAPNADEHRALCEILSGRACFSLGNDSDSVGCTGLSNAVQWVCR